jgi:short subunit dehydrogenase-like uncharacterized protein
MALQRNNGQLNKAQVAITMADSSLNGLSANASHMGEAMIRVARQGEATRFIPTAMGSVNSPNFQQQVNVTVELIKTSAPAQAYIDRIATDSFIGEFSVKYDASNLTPETVHNGAIMNIEEFGADGADATIKVTLTGVIYINNNKL